MRDTTTDLLTLHRAIRRLLAERVERGATDESDGKLLVLRIELERLERECSS